jgi:hypothetical protein
MPVYVDTPYKAQYNSVCVRCGGWIEKGDIVRTPARRTTFHDVCPANPVPPPPLESEPATRDQMKLIIKLLFEKELPDGMILKEAVVNIVYDPPTKELASRLIEMLIELPERAKP